MPRCRISELKKINERRFGFVGIVVLAAWWSTELLAKYG